tara:strand:+ start:9042 stop:9728 length:687 start_codon:yes stop_codon:yes gene_type:complete
MIETFYGIILALFLSIIHFYSNFLKNITKLKGRIFLSLSAGILITLIFVEMIPMIAEQASKTLFILMLAGFAVFHLVERHAYQHHHSIRKRIKEITNLHLYGFFFEHFIIGFFLVLILESSLTTGMIAIIPFILMTISSSISLEAIHKVTKKHKLKKIFLSSSTTLGAILATFLKVSPDFFYYSLSFIIGSIIYIVTKDIIPSEEKEKHAEFFVIGAIITLLSLSLPL